MKEPRERKQIKVFYNSSIVSVLITRLEDSIDEVSAVVATS
jgi:hypothetical protein